MLLSLHISSKCLRCRRTLLHQWLQLPALYSARALHVSPVQSRGKLRPPRQDKVQLLTRWKSNWTWHKIPEVLSAFAQNWRKSGQVKKRIATMGAISSQITQALLLKFVRELPELRDNLTLAEKERLVEDLAENLDEAADRELTRRFLDWATSSQSAREIAGGSVIARLQTVGGVLDATYPSGWYYLARRHRRKIIMHVGPTNSGKTYQALQSLASARLGVYAGPLRLLAHEIYDRFNKGLILPPDASPDDPPGKYARPCNMLTGEESRVVDVNAGLTSCTVEMLNYSMEFDVAVVDEIQMITDPERGGGWTAAVLGLHAKEVHLCGEDSVVPLIEAMVEETGDELIVNRYGRLSPLVVAKESLDGELTRIQKGDCMVVFSRGGIFSMKRAIEEVTGMRCAVIYGKLPPEVRSEQAALFNDPDSGYDVLVGSDALGMGLNLKIKRMIFESMSKWDGRDDVPLSISQVKQIAGRAGRYGLHGPDSAGGVVTTLKGWDLPKLRKAIATPLPSSIKRAVLCSQTEIHSKLETLLEDNSFETISDIVSRGVRLGQHYTIGQMYRQRGTASSVDSLCQGLTLSERMSVFLAPIQWRDEKLLGAVRVMIALFRDGSQVDLKTLMSTEDTGSALTYARKKEEEGAELRRVEMALLLQSLETLYRVLVVYLWFSYRYPLAFSEREEAMKTKTQTEKAIEWCLQNMRSEKAKKQVWKVKTDTAEGHDGDRKQQLILADTIDAGLDGGVVLRNGAIHAHAAA